MSAFCILDTPNKGLNEWKNAIKSIITKEHFYKLENVIILLRISSHDIDRMFQIFAKHVQLLKYQFKRFIIGLCVDDVHYHVLEWNQNIDAKCLDHFKQLCYQKQKQPEMKEKYQLLMNEWSA